MKLTPILMASAVAAVLAGPVAAQEPNADTVLATVGDEVITLGHVIVMVDRLPDNYKSLPDAQLFDGLLQQMINQSALAQTRDANAKSVQLGLDNERRALLASDALDEAGEAAIDPEKVAAQVAEALENAINVLELKASHILVDTEEEAKALVVELENGADFAALAKEHSTGPSGPNGGDLGWFRPERMVPEFAVTVKIMAVDTIGGPVQTQFGWHVIKLFDTREVKDLDAHTVEHQIEDEMRSAGVNAAMTSAREGLDVTVSSDGIDPALIRQMDLVAE